MNCEIESQAAGRNAGSMKALCSACIAQELNLCHAFAAASNKPPQVFLPPPETRSGPARRIICRERDLQDVVPFICQGWAAASAALPDGRRQILAFLLPGDIVSTALLFEPTAHCLVEAVTDVQFRNYKRSDLKNVLFENPQLIHPLSKTWIAEKLRADQLAIDLGRRTAHERIARLIMSLMERLRTRGMARGQTMEFPLRQRHIADATGLTPAHVNKVLAEFRRSGAIEIVNRKLTILDPAAFDYVANLR